MSFQQGFIPFQKKIHKRNGEPDIWVVGAGKGGVGKSFVSSSLAISLSKLGYSCTLVDLDFGGANLHTCIDAPKTNISLKDFLDGKIREINEIRVRTDIPNCTYIPGLWDAWDPVSLDEHEREKLINSVRKIDSDFVILDLGAGAYQSNLDFFRYADKRILVTTPEPTSIENAYRYLETLVIQSLRQHCSEPVLEKLINEARRQRAAAKHGKPFSFTEMIQTLEPVDAERLITAIKSCEIGLIINQARSHADSLLGTSIRTVSQKYFGFPVSYLGYLDYDNAVWQSMRKRKPPILDNPFTRLVGQFLSITKSLVGTKETRIAV